MHCTHEGHEADNGHAARKTGQRPKKRVTAPPTLHIDNGKGPEKGHKAEKKEAATISYHYPRGAHQPEHNSTYTTTAQS